MNRVTRIKKIYGNILFVVYEHFLQNKCMIQGIYDYNSVSICSMRCIKTCVWMIYSYVFFLNKKLFVNCKHAVKCILTSLKIKHIQTHPVLHASVWGSLHSIPLLLWASWAAWETNKMEDFLRHQNLLWIFI